MGHENTSLRGSAGEDLSKAMNHEMPSRRGGSGGLRATIAMNASVAFRLAERQVFGRGLELTQSLISEGKVKSE